MTTAEIRTYNCGVADVLAASTTRPLAEGFAIEALQELATAGAALLLPMPADPLKTAQSRH